jgi:hypothetical protein
MTKQETKDVILKLIQELGRFPRIQEIANVLDTNVYQTQLMLKALVKDGFLRMEGNWYRLAKKNPGVHIIEGGNPVSQPMKITGPVPDESEVPEPKPKGSWITNVLTTKKSNDAPKETREKIDWTIVIIRTAMTLVGLGAMTLSFYFTHKWLDKVMPSLLAIVLSGIIVMFSIFAFEIVLLFSSKQVTDKGWRWVVAALFFIMWFPVVAFSMTNTISGQYDEHVAEMYREAQKNLAVNAGRTQWQLLLNEEKDLREQVQQKRDDITRFKSMLPTQEQITADPRKQRDWNNNQWRITLADRDIKILLTKLEQNRTKKEQLLQSLPQATDADEVTGKVETFHMWAAKILGVEPQMVQFWLAAFPAVFIDIIAPAAFAIALFLRRRRRNLEEDMKFNYNQSAGIPM